MNLKNHNKLIQRYKSWMMEAGMMRNSQKLSCHLLLLLESCRLNPLGWRSEVLIFHLRASSCWIQASTSPAQMAVVLNPSLGLGFIWLNTGAVGILYCLIMRWSSHLSPAAALRRSRLRSHCPLVDIWDIPWHPKRAGLSHLDVGNWIKF